MAVHAESELHMGQVNSTERREQAQQTEYDLMMVLGAQMEMSDKVPGRWKLHTFKEDYSGKVVGGNAKATATNIAVENGLVKRLVFTGGREQAVDDEGNTHVGSRADELMALTKRKMDIGKANLVTRGEDSSAYDDVEMESIGTEQNGHTWGNVQDLKNYLIAHEGEFQPKKIGVLSWGVHLERFDYFLKCEPYFAQHGIELVPVSVESQLDPESNDGSVDPRYSQWLHEVKATDEWQLMSVWREKVLKISRMGIMYSMMDVSWLM